MDYTMIKGERFNVKMNLQDFILFTMKKLFSIGAISESEQEKLQSRDYCKTKFNLKYSLLSKDMFSDSSDRNHPRYYAKETFFEQGLYLCNDWYPKRNEELFAKWLKEISDQ